MPTLNKRKIPLLDLKAQHATIREEVLTEVVKVVDAQRFIMGEEVAALEGEIAKYTDSQFAVGCASGSDALFLALLGVGVTPGDEVLTTPYTFFATAGAIHRAGATPVFVDIDPTTFNIDVNLAAVELRSRPRLKAVIPVHLFGACADMDPLMAAAREAGVAVIEDAAQAIGAEYNGKRAGSIGDIACFSFFPSKNLGGYGDGGMLTTNDPATAERLRALRLHGSRKKYYHDWVGINSRLDTLQAAALKVKLRYLDGWTAARQRNADAYRRLFAQSGAPIVPPAVGPNQTRHVYNQFCIVAPRRDELQAYLKANGIGTEVYYPLPLHLQKCFAHLGYGHGSMPVSERMALESLALPIYPELTDADISYIAETISDFYLR